MWVYDQCLTMHTDFDALPHAELDAVFHHSGNWGQRTPAASSQCLGDRYSRLRCVTRRDADQVQRPENGRGRDAIRNWTG